ncbi:flavodoxin family protein, partial [Chloroflexota bacterium]
IVAIVGSPRPKGNTNYLVDRALEAAEELGAQVKKIDLSKYKINPCLGHDDCPSFECCTQKDDAVWILDESLNADGIILATPVYWYNVSAQMKAFIDRNHFHYKHKLKYRAKSVGLIVAATMEGIDDTLHTLNHFIDWRFDIKTGRRLIVSGYADKVGEAENNLTLVEEAKQLGSHMVESIKEAA